MQRNTANSSCIQTENKLERVTVCLTATYKSSLVFFCLRRYFYFFNLPSPLVLVCNSMSQELFLVYYRCLGKSRQWCNRTSHWIALQRKTKKCTPLSISQTELLLGTEFIYQFVQSIGSQLNLIVRPAPLRTLLAMSDCRQKIR